MDYSLIYKCIDEGLAEWKELGLMQIPDPHMPPEMVDNKRPRDNDWIPWKPIASTVTDHDIEEIEIFSGIPFPESFKAFLKYKHFYELGFSNPMEVVFFDHPVHTWKRKYFDYYSYDWVRKYLLAKKYLPFAAHYDWGILCFDANEPVSDHEYTIVMIDHELVWDELMPFQLFNANFMEMVSQRLLKK